MPQKKGQHNLTYDVICNKQGYVFFSHQGSSNMKKMPHLSPSEHIGTLGIYPYLLFADELTLFQAGGLDYGHHHGRTADVLPYVLPPIKNW